MRLFWVPRRVADRGRLVWRRWFGVPGSRVLALLAILLVAINSLGVWGIIYSGREARSEVRKDLELQAFAGARSLEATLASTRADFLFVAQSPPIAGFREALEGGDPMARRWHRLDMEATLLLFLTSHPEVERISLSIGNTPFLVAGRRDGAPVVLPSEEADGVSPDHKQLVLGRWPLGPVDAEGRIEALLSIPRLLAMATPSQDYSLELRPLNEISEANTATEGSDAPVVVPVQDPDWSPPIDWAMIWSERRAGLIESVTRMTDRYRMTLVFNVLLLVLAAILGAVSVRQAKRGIALEIENKQQSQIRELERQLMHSERLATVGRLAAGLAHEINNPLEGMANYLVLLEEDVRSRRHDSCLEFIEKVREGLRRAAGVTRRALTFAEPGQRPNTILDMQQVVQDTVEYVRGNRLFRNVNLTLDTPDQEFMVRGNPVTLGQAFLNLLLNAAEIQGGQGAVEVGVEQSQGEVVVSIADRGPGIDPELLPRIFDPFVSGRDSTGLGLSICRTIVEGHDGSIEASNRTDGGAVFLVRVPLADTHELRTAVQSEKLAPAAAVASEVAS